MTATTSEGNACFQRCRRRRRLDRGGANTELFEFVFGMVSAGCGNISAKSNGDNAPSSPSTIGKAFESQSLFSTTALRSCCWMGGTLLIFLFTSKREFNFDFAYFLS